LQVRRRKGDAVDGVLLLDKPVGITSNAALQVARRALNARKAGHTGTLDPLASGLLPIALGEAAKFAGALLDAPKSYRATLRLGVATASGDADGEVTARRPVAVDAARLDATLSRFVGTILQVPPMHSALKRDGRPLYEYARRGLEVERAAREVTIHRLERRRFEGDELDIDVDCSKGTYVRVLAQDIGEQLGCGAHLSALRRTRVGPLSLDDAIALDRLEGLDPAARRARLRPADLLLQELPRIDLDAEAAERLRHGQRLALGLRPVPRARIYDDRGRLAGVAAIDDGGVLAPLRLVNEECRESEPAP